MGIGFKHWRRSSVCLVDHLGILQDIKPALMFPQNAGEHPDAPACRDLAGPGGRCVLAAIVGCSYRMENNAPEKR